MHGAFIKLKMVSMWPECFSYLIIYKLYENDYLPSYHNTWSLSLCVMIFFFFNFVLTASSYTVWSSAIILGTQEWLRLLKVLIYIKWVVARHHTKYGFYGSFIVMGRKCSLDPIETTIWREAGYILNKSPVCCWVNTETRRSYLESPVNVTLLKDKV